MAKNNNKHGLYLAALLASTLAGNSIAVAGEFRLLPAAAVDEKAAAAPDTKGGLLAPQAAAPVTPAGEVAAVAAPRPANLVPFEQAKSSLQLTGEDDVSVLSFYLNAAQLAGDGQLQFAYQNAVSVLPDSASVDIAVNGKPAGSFAIRSPNGIKLETLSIPASALKAGRNEVRLHARQHHRVDCSLDATYELWTRLDPTQSGFMAASNVAFSSVDDLLAVGRNMDGMTEIRLITPASGGTAALNDSMAVVQSLALLLDRPDVVIKTGDQPGTGPGIDLYVGSGSEQAQAVQTRAIVAGAPLGLSVRPGVTSERATVIMRGSSRADINASLLKAVRGSMRASLDSGVFSRKSGSLNAEAATRYSLRDVGYVSSPFAGRLSRTHFDMTMPADFYPAEYDTLNFYLDGATAPGLARGAQLLVRVNDRVVSSYPFRNTNGEKFAHKRIALPLRSLRPGVNRIELLAELPVAADAACQPQARADDKPRFMMLDTSELEVPNLARIGRLPDLGALSGNGYPFRDGKPFNVFVNQPDVQSISAALTTVARLSLAARKPLAADLKFSAPVDGDGRNALVIASTPLPLAAAATPASGLDTALSSALDVFGQDKPANTDPVTTAALSLDPGAIAGGSTETDDLLQAFQDSTAVKGDNESLSARVQGWIANSAGRFRHWLKYEDPAQNNLSRSEAGALVTLSQTQAPSGLGTWTVIKADTPENMAIGMARLADPSVWSRLEGGTATIRAENRELVTGPAANRFVTEITDSSFWNFRRLAASWFSDNFQFYILLVIVLMGGFGAWLGLTVPRRGVRTDK